MEFLARADDKAVHHQLNAVLLLLVQFGGVVDLIQLTVDAHADKAALAGLLQQLRMLALAGAHHRGQHLHAGALGVFLHGVHHLVHRLLADFFAALGAVGNADARPQKAQVVVNLRHRAHGGAGVAAGGFLIDGNGGAQPLDGVHIRLFHLPQEHPGVAGQAFHIAPLTLGIQGVEGQAALA